MIQNTGSMERGKCHDESARANNIKSVFCGGETERERERERENGLEDRSSGTWATLAHFYQSSCLPLSLSLSLPVVTAAAPLLFRPFQQKRNELARTSPFTSMAHRSVHEYILPAGGSSAINITPASNPLPDD